MGVRGSGSQEVKLMAARFRNIQRSRKHSIFLLHPGNFPLAAVLYGLAVHMKIYPVVYSLPLYLHLGSHESLCDDSSLLTFLKNSIKKLIPNKTQLVFVLVSAFTFIAVSLFCFWLYGHPFLHQTYLYHIRYGISIFCFLRSHLIPDS